MREFFFLTLQLAVPLTEVGIGMPYGNTETLCRGVVFCGIWMTLVYTFCRLYAPWQARVVEMGVSPSRRWLLRVAVASYICLEAAFFLFLFFATEY